MMHVTLPEICSADGLFIDGDWIETKDQDPNGDVRLIQMMDIAVGRFLNKSSRFLTKSAAERLKCTFLKPGDILIARMPDPIGRACIFPGVKQPAVTAVDVCIVRPDEKRVFAPWLVHVINSPVFRASINKWIKGTTRQRISRTNLGNITFPLPPLPEQRRIAAILDKADAIRRKREQAIKLANSFLRSLFLDMFGDPVTNPKGWEVVNLGDICKFYSGTTLPEGQYYNGQKEGYLLLKVSDLNNYCNREVVCQSALWFGVKVRGAIYAPIGSVVIPKRGGAIFTNKKRLLSREAALDPNLMAISPTSEAITKEFLYSWFLLFDLTRITGGSSVPQLNKQDLAPLKVYVPPLDKQKSFSMIFDRITVLKCKLHGDTDNMTFVRLFENLKQMVFNKQS